MTENERKNMAAMIRVQLGVAVSALRPDDTAEDFERWTKMAEKAEKAFINDEVVVPKGSVH